eukprot:1121451-Pleurochrysis_carterae.AAC.2
MELYTKPLIPCKVHPSSGNVVQVYSDEHAIGAGLALDPIKKTGNLCTQIERRLKRTCRRQAISDRSSRSTARLVMSYASHNLIVPAFRQHACAPNLDFVIFTNEGSVSVTAPPAFLPPRPPSKKPSFQKSLA